MPTPPQRCGRMFKARIFPDATCLERDVVDLLRHELQTPVTSPAAVLLAGGRTPLAAYAALAAEPLHISDRWHALYSDDRHVPVTDPRSNAGVITPLLRQLGFSPGRIMQVDGTDELEAAAGGYARQLAAFFDAGGRIPLGLLGLGADGHTASLFNAEQVATGRGRWAQAVARPDGLNGVSVTADLLTRVARVIFLVTGEEKRSALRRLLTAPDQVAAGLAVAGAPRVEVWMDQAAWPMDPPAARGGAPRTD